MPRRGTRQPRGAAARELNVSGDESAVGAALRALPFVRRAPVVCGAPVVIKKPASAGARRVHRQRLHAVRPRGPVILPAVPALEPAEPAVIFRARRRLRRSPRRRPLRRGQRRSRGGGGGDGVGSGDDVRARERRAGRELGGEGFDSQTRRAAERDPARGIGRDGGDGGDGWGWGIVFELALALDAGAFGVARGAVVAPVPVVELCHHEVVGFGPHRHVRARALHALDAVLEPRDVVVGG
mmetsp:Transcript_12320/g.51851  ORF Transcript_12320/g.51851 Transcript_12320/m.51851 type:complete len:240 (-) Transcript_12320:363-1082(-)